MSALERASGKARPVDGGMLGAGAVWVLGGDVGSAPFPSFCPDGRLRLRAAFPGASAWLQVVLMTTKGEAVAIGIAQMATSIMATCDHGVVAKIKVRLVVLWRAQGHRASAGKPNPPLPHDPCMHHRTPVLTVPCAAALTCPTTTSACCAVPGCTAVPDLRLHSSSSSSSSSCLSSA